MDVAPTELDLSYKQRYKGQRLPDAYERLIWDVSRGDHSLFVRHDEVAAAWRLFTPLLHWMEEDKPTPIIYTRGGRGPKESDALIAKYYIRDDTYSWTDRHASL